MRSKVPLLYILGTPYCGSTLLGFILGAASPVFNAGEIQHFRRFPDIRNRLCSCGRPVHSCPVWGPLDFSPFRLFSKLKRPQQLLVTLHFLADRLPARPFRTGSHDALFLKTLWDRLEHLGLHPRYILDNSKSPFRLLHLMAFKELDLRILHLQRGIHGNVASFVKAEDGFLWGTLKYLLINRMAKKLSALCHHPFLSVRYEDFCRDPQGELDRIGRFLEVAVQEDIVRAVRESPLHVFTGSDWRHHFSRNFQGVSLDTSWENRLSGPQIRFLGVIRDLLRLESG